MDYKISGRCPSIRWPNGPRTTVQAALIAKSKLDCENHLDAGKEFDCPITQLAEVKTNGFRTHEFTEGRSHRSGS